MSGPRKRSEQPLLSICLPVWNEAENVPELVGRLFPALQAADVPHELVVVDDDSEDGTAEAFQEYAKDHPIRVIVRKNERGLGSAIHRGLRESTGEILSVMDADLSHPPEVMPRLYRAVVEDGYEMAIGSRYVRGGGTVDWGWNWRLNSWGASFLARPLIAVRDPMSGFSCFPRFVYDRADVNPISCKITLEILVKCRPRRVREIPIIFANRTRGESKISMRRQIDYLIHLARLYQRKFL